MAAVKGMDYRLVNLGVIAVIVACALLLWVVGRRGSGERAVVSAIAYAQALGDGDFAATQWSSCFVTASGDYAITHPGGLSLFSCPSDAEEADAVISVERGELKASIPLFSSRTFVHSARIHLAGTEPQVVASKADAQLRELSIRLPAGGAARSWSERMLNARAVYRDRIYSLARANEVLTLTPGSASTLEEFTGIVAQRANMYPGVASGDDAGKRLRLLDEDFETLIAYGLGGHGLSRDWCDQRRDPDQVALFLLVDQAPAFHIADGMASQGRAVLRFDLPLTRSAP